MTIMRGFISRRFWIYFVLPNAIFGVLAVATSASVLIPFLNLIVIALSVNVCVAFAPNILDIMARDRQADRADLLIMGIFCSWFAIVLRTAFSLAWRYVGEPKWWTDTDFGSYFVYLSLCAALFHLLAPGAMKESIPPERWIRIGALIGAAVFIGLLMLYMSDVQDRAKALIQEKKLSFPSEFVRPM